MKRGRSEGCPSDFQLDRSLAGELSPEQQRDLERHVSACAVCHGRQAERLVSQRRFGDEAPPFAELERAARQSALASLDHAPRRPAQRERKRWLAGASALAAAVLAVVLRSPWAPAPSPAGVDGTRAKGGAATLGWVVRRDGHVLPGRPEEPLRAGDALRFSVSTREPVYVAVLGVEAGGKVSVYHPQAPLLSRVDIGQDQLLPAAIVFDAAPIGERLFAIFCTSPVPVASLTHSIQAAPDAPALPPGCSVERWRLQGIGP